MALIEQNWSYYKTKRYKPRKRTGRKGKTDGHGRETGKGEGRKYLECKYVYVKLTNNQCRQQNPFIGKSKSSTLLELRKNKRPHAKEKLRGIETEMAITLCRGW